MESHVLITENNKIVTISAVNLHVCKKSKYGRGDSFSGAIQNLMEKELLYQNDDGAYVVYEKFFALWLKQH